MTIDQPRLMGNSPQQTNWCLLVAKLYPFHKITMHFIGSTVMKPSSTCLNNKPTASSGCPPCLILPFNQCSPLQRQRRWKNKKMRIFRLWHFPGQLILPLLVLNDLYISFKITNPIIIHDLQQNLWKCTISMVVVSASVLTMPHWCMLLLELHFSEIKTIRWCVLESWDGKFWLN